MANEQEARYTLLGEQLLQENDRLSRCEEMEVDMEHLRKGLGVLGSFYAESGRSEEEIRSELVEEIENNILAASFAKKLNETGDLGATFASFPELKGPEPTPESELPLPDALPTEGEEENPVN